jgi:Fe-S cluster assembly protein SufD
MAATATAHHSLLAAVEHPLGDDRGEPGFVANLRRRARDRFDALGFPTPRLEQWRFTNVKRVADLPFVLATPPAEEPAIEPHCIPGAHRIVLVNGWFSPELSATTELPAGVVLTGLADALAWSPELIEPHLGRHTDITERAFAALNTALFRDGVLLWLASGVTVDRPIQLLMVTTSDGTPTASFPRFTIVAGQSSSATVIESYVGSGEHTLTCPVTEVVLQANSALEHIITHEENPGANHVAVRQAQLSRDSRLHSHTIILGGGLVRTDLDVVLDAEGCHASLNGLSVTSGSQHVDNHVRVHHRAPLCTSHQLYKGILDGASRAVFNGRIVVDAGAQKTDARQSNRSLILSDDALAHSNPQLEILADDVRCTHGSTIGRLDDNVLFYLQSRGLDRAAAESLLTYAFASEIVQAVGVNEVRERLGRALISRLPRGELLRETA